MLKKMTMIRRIKIILPTPARDCLGAVCVRKGREVIIDIARAGVRY